MADVASGPKETILAVEDDEDLQSFLKLHLEAEGYAVEQALTAQEAIASITNKRIDLVLLDLGLPDEDGLLVAEQIRNFSSVPIIVASARTRVDDRLAALGLGADDYVTKPFDPRELVLRIRNIISRSADAKDQGFMNLGAGSTNSEVVGEAKPGRFVLVLGLVILGVLGAGYWMYGPTKETSQIPESPPDYSWIAKSACGKIPKVDWWQNNTHLSVVRHVVEKRNGDWEGYIKKWSFQLLKMEDVYERNSSAATNSGEKLSGDKLKSHIENLRQRVAVIQCLFREVGKNTAS
ncbi:MAG: response regulator transcription factor [Rhodospirillaceae bacterium]|nr:response regulator transcription factor [Rhodospirillales bacterium]MBT3907271.1 response regulator transcription factor [Rhodospirillaceae bacterium]MBT4703099.1 response regulator transcription factor [Rhodospirillaceae bacterium]MBT5034930.1 response regulator transcription factor [Rhodospirillaceae bacterium]MBT6220326.1 response regulator transcription factor [Rhodospirillaceae bacterium]